MVLLHGLFTRSGSVLTYCLKNHYSLFITSCNVEGSFSPHSWQETRGEEDSLLHRLRGFGSRRRWGSRGRTDSKMSRVWFVNGTACVPNFNLSCAAMRVMKRPSRM